MTPIISAVQGHDILTKRVIVYDEFTGDSILLGYVRAGRVEVAGPRGAGRMEDRILAYDPDMTLISRHTKRDAAILAVVKHCITPES